MGCLANLAVGVNITRNRAYLSLSLSLLPFLAYEVDGSLFARVMTGLLFLSLIPIIRVPSSSVKYIGVLSTYAICIRAQVSSLPLPSLPSSFPSIKETIVTALFIGVLVNL